MDKLVNGPLTAMVNVGLGVACSNCVLLAVA